MVALLMKSAAWTDQPAGMEARVSLTSAAQSSFSKSDLLWLLYGF